MKRATAIAVLIFLGMGMATIASAQLGGAEPFTFTFSPEYPRPYETITVIPQSSTVDLSVSTVTVSANGSVVSEGSGAEPAYITVGGPGTATTITVRVVSAGQTYSKSVTVRPADVALVVEPQSTAHPFYAGGQLISAEGLVRLIAIPDIRTSNGTLVPAANLVYTWRNGEQVLQSASGIGKSVLTASAPVKYRDARITVTVTTQDQSIVAETTALVAPADPIVRIYRNDPLLGPRFNTALPRSIALTDTEETFRAVPYFFSGRPALTWQVNSTANDTDQDITVRAAGTGAGSALLGVTAKEPSSSKTANAAVSISFGERRSFSIFGL